MKDVDMYNLWGKNGLRFIVLAVFVLSVSGCNALGMKNTNPEKKKPLFRLKTEAPKPPVYHDFSDVLVPGDFIKNKKYSKMTEKDGLATGFLVLYGPVEVRSTVNFFTVKMPLDGWRPVSSVTTPLSTLMVFNKGKRWCTIDVSETEFTTDVRIGIAFEILETVKSEPSPGPVVEPPVQDVIIKPDEVIEE